MAISEQAGEQLAAEVRHAAQTGDWQRAYDVSNRAISRGLRHPVFFMVRAHRMEAAGHLNFALEDYERAAAVAPDDAGAQDAMGLCALKLERFERAAHAFDAARKLQPEDAGLHYRCGLANARLGREEEAEAAYDDALKADPKFADALASLASIRARQGRAEEARRLAEDALAADPRQATAAVALILADLSERQYASAGERAETLLQSDIVPSEGRPAIYGLLADAFDGQKRYDEAFRAYDQENRMLRQANAARFPTNQGLEALRSLISYFENEPSGRWQAPDNGRRPAPPVSGHVFLLGFMRSGTTLLEQVLASNPEIVALEEEALFGDMSDRYMTSVPALDSLAHLDGAELERERALYWQRLQQLRPDCGGKIVVDKQPLNTIKLPIIAKLFPEARIVFAIRDPRDVVFSCYRRRLKIAPAYQSFLSLDDTARFYAYVMRLGEIFRSKLTLPVLEHRYEDMVADFDGRVRAVCEFIGTEWTDTMREFDRQESVVDIRSPSALQVRRPLYGEGVAQWRRYAKHLAPVYPVLDPWVEKFGYAKD